VIITCPKADPKPWPTLGPYVCDFIVSNLAHGPGDLVGEDVRMDKEKEAFIYALYEVYPKKHPKAGRRRYKRGAISVRKGLAKTEFAAWIAAAELSQFGPVRTVDWDKKGYPIGGPVKDPYIPLVAYTEEQTEELAYGALRVILTASRISEDFDIGLDRIMRIDGHGKAAALASSPNAADGARTTFQHFDETHRFTLARLKKAHSTMLANIPKRKLADAWSLETTTAFAPGENSVAEDTMAYARAILEGKAKDEQFFFFHRQAADGHDLSTERGARAAVLEATGAAAASWAGDIDTIVAQVRNPPDGDRSYSERVWTNRLVRGADKAFNPLVWAKLARRGYMPADGALIVIGFDGAKYEDATAIIGTEVKTGFQWVLGIWEKPLGPSGQGWETPAAEVDEVLRAAMKRWKVWRVYADPPHWESSIDAWSGEYGEETIVRWPTNRWPKMAAALAAYRNAMKAGELGHDGNEQFGRHIGNAFRKTLAQRDENKEPLWIIYKERKDSPNKIDGAVAGALSWEARGDCVAAGMLKSTRSVYEDRDMVEV
jgi:phage terminase large subunit-like protein